VTTSTQWQLAREAAQRYEQILVPTILGPAAGALVAWSALSGGETVLDVGCGTGAAARLAVEQVGHQGRIVGVDINTGMIEIARSLSSANGTGIEWREASAYQLPLGGQSVDVVLCAQTLQFLDDRPAALAEMHRVLKPTGRLAASLWCGIQESPYFHLLVDAISRHIGEQTAAGLRAAFGLSDAAELGTLLRAAGFQHIEMAIEQLELTLPRLEEFIPRHVSATPMAAGYRAASPLVQQAVIQEVTERLAPYGIGTDTAAHVPFRMHLALATKA
jgi:ubiquinone/menaquinone biosynthesis C-methylase UbiE